MQIEFTASGRSGSVELYSSHLVIKKKFGGMSRKHTSGDKEIYLDNIKNINYKKANSLTFGYIQFVTSDNLKQLSKASIMSSPNDDFTVNFSTHQEKQFTELKNKINDFRNNPKSQNESQSSMSAYDEIEKLANLKEKGIITDDEFQAKKTQLLGL